MVKVFPFLPFLTVQLIYFIGDIIYHNTYIYIKVMNDVEPSLPKDYVPSFSRKLLFFVTYGVVILAATSPLASYAAMHNDIPNFTSSSSFLVYGIATIGTGCGKLLPGYVVARFGARAIYLYLIFTIGILCMLLSFSQTVMHVAICEVYNTSRIII